MDPPFDVIPTGFFQQHTGNSVAFENRLAVDHAPSAQRSVGASQARRMELRTARDPISDWAVGSAFGVPPLWKWCLRWPATTRDQGGSALPCGHDFLPRPYLVLHVRSGTGGLTAILLLAKSLRFLESASGQIRVIRNFLHHRIGTPPVAFLSAASTWRAEVDTRRWNQSDPCLYRPPSTSRMG